MKDCNVQKEVARIVDEQWFGVDPSPSSYGSIRKVTYEPYIRPYGESAPYWRVWVGDRGWGVRPSNALDIAWLRVAVELS